MKRLESVKELKQLHDTLTAGPQPVGTPKRQILLCAGGGCIASGSLQVAKALREAIASSDLDVPVIETGCLGPCAGGPVLVVQPDGVYYQHVNPSDVAEIVSAHLVGNRVVERLASKSTATGEIVPLMKDLEYFRKQVKIVLRNCGLIDPLRIHDYVARDGYLGLAKALTEMTPETVIDEVKASGLRGRGGGGFPTGLKWAFAAKSKGEVKYVLCNADEGDPGAFMDRSVLEGDPHSVIEAMTIAAYCIGSHQGYVYVRAEYPLAIERLGIALQQARDLGVLGHNILGTGFDFDLEIRKGSGAFVCGEETALMTSIEGRRGEPRPRPPFPAVKGLWARPSLLNNVETYANIPVILLKGASWYASYGTPKSKGTKVFALAGAVRNTGLVEIPIGMPLGELVFEVGGGIPGNKKFKAAQLGGPSGGCIPTEHLGVPVDYESLIELGAIIGSGGLIVMDEDACMVDVARFFLDFCQDESCGKCAPCRIGTKRMLEILERICEGKGEEGDVERLIVLGNTIKDTALCGLGQTAPNPVLSTIRYFRHEYDAHIREKRCPAGTCAALVRAPCQNACPAGVDVPGFVSLVGEGRYQEAMRHHRERNPFASICARVCFHPCESKCRRTTLDGAPVAIRGVKRFMVEQDVATETPEVRVSEANAKRKIAIIGAGPAGLSAAYFLARLGYHPEVFEAEAEPGGMLVQTIPSYRLPRKALADEIELIQSMGVKIHCNQRLGRDLQLEDLPQQGYEAVFLAIGAANGSKLGLPGDDAAGVVDAMQFLKEFNLSGKTDVGRNVAVIGGGNAAIDAARTARRLGADKVTVVYRRRRNEMPAWDEEIDAMLDEGIALETLVAPIGLVVQNGRVTGLECQRMELGSYDKSGRRRPTPIKGSTFVMPADQVIAAIGQSVDGSFAPDFELDRNRDGTIQVDSLTGRTSVPWLFAGGDVATGPASVVEAIAAGERAAVGIDLMFSGEAHAFWRAHDGVDTAFDPDAEPDLTPRADGVELPATARKGFEEVELPWAEQVARCEAHRCLRCDYRESCH